MSAATAAPPDRDMLAGYRLRRLRGMGSFGRVWEADAPDGKVVAVKSVACKPGLASLELRNVRNVCQFSHPHILRIDKVWCETDNLNFVMELADGSLQDLLDVSQMEFGAPLSAYVLGEYMHQAAAAIDFLNARTHVISSRRVGVQHRDIKPSNLLLFGDQVRLCDFGLATATIAPLVRHVSSGTPAYAAPEVFRGQLSDWTDQYALAASYAYLRSGQPPFADTPPDFRPDYVRPAPDLSKLDPAERAVIARGLAAVPQDRWPSCQDMARALLALVPKHAANGLSERRLGDRRPCPHRPRLRIVTQAAASGFRAMVANLSHTGIGLLVERPLGMGIDFMFIVPGIAEDKRRVLSARVVRGMPQADGGWFAGCRLALPLTELEFETLVRP